MLELIYQGQSIATVRDPDPRVIQNILTQHIGIKQRKPTLPTSHDGYFVLPWDEYSRNYQEVARLHEVCV